MPTLDAADVLDRVVERLEDENRVVVDPRSVRETAEGETVYSYAETQEPCRACVLGWTWYELAVAGAPRPTWPEKHPLRIAVTSALTSASIELEIGEPYDEPETAALAQGRHLELVQLAADIARRRIDAR